MYSSAPKPVVDCISRVLKREAKKGSTSKHDIVALSMNEMRKHGDYGLPPAMLQTVAARIYGTEAMRQLKKSLPKNVSAAVLKNAPPELVQVMGVLPEWISLGDGHNARWVPALSATADQWRSHAAMKERKGQATLDRADAAGDLARYLEAYGLDSLEDVLGD